MAGSGVLAFDAERMQPRWHRLTGHSYDALVLSDTTLLVAGSAGLYALEASNGDVRWHRDFATRPFAPVVQSGVAYVGSEGGTLRALRVSDGALLWQRRFTGWIYSPAVVNGRLILTGQQPLVRAVSISEATPLWHRSLGQESVYRPVAVGSDTVVVTTFAGEVLALGAEDGRLRWHIKDVVANHSPIPAGNLLLFPDFSGTLTARRLSDGRAVWRSEVPVAPQSVQSIDGGVVARDRAGNLVELDPVSGVLRQRHIRNGLPLGAPVKVGTRLLSFSAGTAGALPHVHIVQTPTTH